jgi:putative transposase
MLKGKLRRVPREGAYIGRNRYFVTVNVLDRQPAFTSAQLVETCRTHTQAAYLATGFGALTECYMPDHLHLLLEGLTGAADLRRCMKDLKQRTAFHVKRLHGRQLWQDGYHDRILRQDENVANYVDYIVQNPVRAGLVDRPEDYPYTFNFFVRAPSLLVP